MTAEQLQEFVMQAHDQLHKGKVGKAHDMLHKAMGIDNDKQLPSAPMAHTADFDAAFRALCISHNAKAMYVLAAGESAKGTRIMSGGDAELCGYFDRKLK